MPDASNIETPPPTPNNTEGKMITKYNMSELDILALDKARKSAQTAFMDSRTSVESLVICFEALEEMWIIFKHASSDKWHKKVKARIDEIREILNTEELRFGDGEARYIEVRMMVLKLMDTIYEAKQMTGLGFYKMRLETQDSKLDELI